MSYLAEENQVHYRYEHPASESQGCAMVSVPA